jgi:glycerol uptake facilitator protein
MRDKAMVRACAAEVVGTFLLVFFGTGAVFVAVLTGALQGLFQVAIVWAVAIALAIHATSALSGTHINPAVTLAALCWREFPPRRVLPYLGSQLFGAFLASAVLYLLFCGVLQNYEREHDLRRGEAGSQLAAMVFGEYFPNPAIVGVGPEAEAQVSHLQAMLAEGIGTALLVFFVFALTDRRNLGRPAARFAGIFIGLGVAIIIVVIAPLTQAGLNPARDLGPRLFAWCIGFGQIAIPGPRGGFFTVYILAPIVGGILGGFAYDRIIRPGLPETSATQRSGSA